jgi:hypothetical protein
MRLQGGKAVNNNYFSNKGQHWRDEVGKQFPAYYYRSQTWLLHPLFLKMGIQILFFHYPIKIFQLVFEYYFCDLYPLHKFKTKLPKKKLKEIKFLLLNLLKSTV